MIFQSINLAVVTTDTTAVLKTIAVPPGVRDLAIYVKPAAYTMGACIISVCPIGMDPAVAGNYAPVYTDAALISGTASYSQGGLALPATKGVHNATIGQMAVAWVGLPPCAYVRISGHSETADTVDIILMGGSYGAN